jgi:hypothetical protein
MSQSNGEYTRNTQNTNRIILYAPPVIILIEVRSKSAERKGFILLYKEKVFSNLLYGTKMSLPLLLHASKHFLENLESWNRIGYFECAYMNMCVIFQIEN